MSPLRGWGVKTGLPRREAQLVRKPLEYRIIDTSGPPRPALPIRGEQQARVALGPSGGSRLRAHGPGEPWEIDMRMAQDLSIIRANQADGDGPLLLSEPISKNEVKITLRRRKWGSFYRKSYTAGYGATTFLLGFYVDSGKMGSRRQNGITHCQFMACVKSPVFEISKNPENCSKL